MSIAAALAADLVAALQHEDGVPRPVLLWLDPDGAFTRVREAVGPELAMAGVDLLALDPGASQVELKLQLLDIEGAGGRAVVHLPQRTLRDFAPGADGRPPSLWSLIEYRFKGATWGHVSDEDAPDPPTLDRWLERHGLRYSGGGARGAVTAGGADSKLARYVARKAYLSPDDLPRPINSAAISPAGDPRDRMIELLLDPGSARDSWADSVADILELASEAFEVSWEGQDAAGWSSQLAAHLAIVDAWDAAGRPATFPFRERVPAGDKARAAVLEFVRRGIVPRPDVLARVRGLVLQSAAEIGPLTTWATGQPGLPVLLPDVLDTRVAAITRAVADAQSAGLAQQVSVLAAALPGDVAVAAVDPRLGIMAAVVDLSRRIADVRPQTEGAADSLTLVTAYRTEAWRIDSAWLRIAAACRELPELAPVRSLAARCYAGFVDLANQRFTDLVEQAGAWPPAGLPSITEDADALWTRSSKVKRKAVIVVDALRLDIAQELAQRLGSSAELHVRASTLPTTTPFGMTALLPDAARAEAAFKAGVVSLSIGEHAALEKRDGRKAYVQHLMSTRGETVGFAELESVLQGDPVPDARFLVLFTYALDDQGHSVADTASLPEEAAKLPARLERVIGRLQASGFSQVDVVTDHGFLWLDPSDTDALQHPSVPSAQVVSRNPRYLLLEQGAVTTDVVRLPVPFAPAVEAGFPRGARTFTKATWYLHGGLSLNECVIPHVISRAAAAPRRVGAAFQVPATELSAATIAVRVRPVVDAPEGDQLMLEAPRAVTIGLEILTADDAARRVSDLTTVELRHDSPELGTAVYLAPGVRIAAGSTLILRGYDLDTGEELLRQELRMLVDWD